MTIRTALLATLLLFALPAAAAPADEGGWALDVEVDPLAWALDGFSVHVGGGYDRFRLDLGAYAMDMPSWMHGNDDLTASFVGAGAKLQYFPFAVQTGGFVGVGAGWARATIEREAFAGSAEQDRFGIGAHVGWRFDLIAGLYATPWIGFDYNFGAEDVNLGDATFASSAWTIFPAVHVGWGFR